MDTLMICLKLERKLNGKLYESRVVITRNRARRASHKLDCTGITEYVLLVIRAYALFFL
ncbi:hypothetical protein HanPSC8_Chr10g0443711 [Helianthus annuus]|nr:hypothetical protein HanPSC8_Chr10g0443711 [Helianthus annuus]